MKSIYSQSYRALLTHIAQARKEAGITQADLAEQLGRPQSFVSKIESGERRIDVVEFLQVAHLIGFDPCALLHGLRLMPNQKTRKSAKKPKA
ncbi:MAG: DNA-binding protein [archaeon GW2011_AR11]|nr:MAG: DNA-binding protein [archaeon GW2011_AR11]